MEELLERERIAQVELNNATLEAKKIESKLTSERSTNTRMGAEYEETKNLLEETKR